MPAADSPVAFSSDKCDFRVRGKDFTLSGSVQQDAARWVAQLPNFRAVAGSDKCDWRIISRADLVESYARSSIADKAVQLGGRAAGSDKCDWRINFEREELASRLGMQLPQLALRASSSKCDWRIDTVAQRFRGSLAGDPAEWAVRGQMPGFRGVISSDKCDWRIASESVFAMGPVGGFAQELRLPLPSGRMRMDSDKCDYRVQLNTATTRGDLAVRQSGVDFSSFDRGIGGAVASSKCDWRIRAFDEVFRAAASANRQSLDVEATARTFRGMMESSKCDWSIRAAGSIPEAVRPPQLSAELVTRGKGFDLQLTLGLKGGPALKVNVAGSDKCDFRVESIEESVDGKQWRQARLAPKDTGR